ncbi:hypothetical protein [Legionella micdadei]|uniref:Putative Glycine-rich protein n=1 Tax=Legionella micdadei TaxID=451 RepID=A0A098GHI0_LEGMI|nr:hypothetical protein [Legionella micdadei]ARG97106.1 hypothetical protein B6N58_05210 [Legionella micdadei]ARH00637.1 hypothetical protein B6V88_09495 [Legionella micdadei]KTD29299.1 hypothetical protein Lmic_1219 [Legionella micdadei]NSL17328.1 hypothetical protein [Legionella micdadei]CEG61455.1 putative Glycine-rich protein [Legionella micdadei]
MLTNSKRNIIGTLVFVIGLLATTAGNAWHSHGSWYGGHRHYHGGYGHGFGRYYGQGGFFYNGGWSGPNIVINVPPRRYYAPVCENVEVCNSFGECWLETYCD